MEMPDLMRAGRTPTALALAVTVWLSSAVSAQLSDKRQHAESTAGDNRIDGDLVHNKPSDLLIETQNASGTLGVALPLEIKLVRVRNVYIEAIKLLGLPRGVTISDSSNTFSSSSDNNDVDVSTWDLSRIQITQNDRRESSFSLAVAAIWTPESGGYIDVTSSRLTVNFAPEHRARIAAANGDDPAKAERQAALTRAEAPASRASETLGTLEAPVAEGAVPGRPPAAPGSTAAIGRPAPPHASSPRPDGTVGAAQLPHSGAPAQPPPGPDPLVERAKALIRRGDISGARLLLERAQSLNAPNATFLLAQTWDPEMHRAWKVRGLRADPDRARSLYAKATDQGRADEARLAATSR